MIPDEQAGALAPLPAEAPARPDALDRAARNGAGSGQREFPVPEIPPAIVARWQEIADLLAEVANVPAALIRMAGPAGFEILTASRSPGSTESVTPSNAGDGAPG